MRKSVEDFIDSTLGQDGYLDMSRKLRQVIQLKQKGGGYLTSTAISDVTPEPKLPKGYLSSDQLTFVDMDELEIARQLTISESKLFYSIRPKELLNQAWSRRDGNEKSLHVLALINRFNVVSQWVTLMVIESDKIKNRARTLEKMIKIALKLRELNNFNTLMSFIGGLNNPAISRLKWTRARIKKKALDDLEKLGKVNGYGRLL